VRLKTPNSPNPKRAKRRNKNWEEGDLETPSPGKQQDNGGKKFLERGEVLCISYLK
jgi:hypothetical protein